MKILILMITLLTAAAAVAEWSPSERVPSESELRVLGSHADLLTSEKLTELKAILASQIERRADIQRSLARDMQTLRTDSPKVATKHAQLDMFDFSIDSLRNTIAQAAVLKPPALWLDYRHDSLIWTLAFAGFALFQLTRLTRHRRFAFNVLRVFVGLIFLLLVSDGIRLLWAARHDAPPYLWIFFVIILGLLGTLTTVVFQLIRRSQAQFELRKLSAMDVG